MHSTFIAAEHTVVHLYAENFIYSMTTPNIMYCRQDTIQLKTLCCRIEMHKFHVWGHTHANVSPHAKVLNERLSHEIL